MSSKSSMPFFERYLSLWVALCIGAGILLGKFLPAVPQFLSKLEYAHVSIPVALLIWMMIYPMMLKIDFSSIMGAAKQGKGLSVTLITNWLIKPFTMYLIAWFFLKVVFGKWIDPGLARDYISGAVLLGAAPCTAMVFVWSHLTKGHPAFTLVQVAVNDLVLLLLFTPIVALLLGINNVVVPYDTLILSVVLFVVIPFSAGFVSRKIVIRKKGLEYFEKKFIEKFKHITVSGLLLTLVILFSFQGHIILENPVHILLIAIPLTIQTFLIFALAYAASRLLKLPHNIASPAALIGSSNFFELAVAVAISLFGLQSGAALVTVVGVLVEVPVMLGLVRISNLSRNWYTRVLNLEGLGE
jgi:ACR3 family arsenite transporter